MANEGRILIYFDELVRAFTNAFYSTMDTRIYSPRDILTSLQGLRIVDAVEVVRCKDCKKWGGVVYGGRCKHWSAPMSGITHFTCADDFCSYGERKDNERKAD